MLLNFISFATGNLLTRSINQHFTALKCQFLSNQLNSVSTYYKHQHLCLVADFIGGLLTMEDIQHI